MADKQTSKELQNVLDQVENVDLKLVFDDLHSLIKVCFQMVGVHSILSGTTSPQIDFQTLINQAIATERNSERKYTDTVVSPVSLRLSQLEALMTKNDHNTANNEKQLSLGIANIQKMIQGVKQDIADMKADTGTHSANQAQILAGMENKILNNQAIIKMLVDHMPKSSKLVDRTYLGDIPIGRQLITKAPWGGKYNIMYTKDGKIIETTTTNPDIELVQVGSSLAIKVLTDGLGVVSIYDI